VARRTNNLADIVGPAWFDLTRRIIIFILGVVVILYAVVSSGHDIPFLVCGLILIGVLPIENFVRISILRKQEKNGTEEEE
jgi:hypothetical protein